MDRWTEIELFVQVAKTGSLSRAAEALDFSNAALTGICWRWENDWTHD